MPPNDSPATYAVSRRNLVRKPARQSAYLSMPKRSGGVGRATGPRRVPGYDRELVGESVELRRPGRWSVSHIAVEKHERRPAPHPLIGDLEPVDLDPLHGTTPRRLRPGQLRTDSRGAGTIERDRRGRLRQEASVATTGQLTLAAEDRRSSRDRLVWLSPRWAMRKRRSGCRGRSPSSGRGPLIRRRVVYGETPRRQGGGTRFAASRRVRLGSPQWTSRSTAAPANRSGRRWRPAGSAGERSSRRP
jgi:hypothetical protein